MKASLPHELRIELKWSSYWPKRRWLRPCWDQRPVHHQVDGVYHVFASTAKESGYHLGVVFLSFPDFNEANSAIFHYLDQTLIETGYRAAPEVFYFGPHKLWYLVYQNGNAAYCTNSDISNPAGWSAPKNFFSSMPSII